MKICLYVSYINSVEQGLQKYMLQDSVLIAWYRQGKVIFQLTIVSIAYEELAESSIHLLCIMCLHLDLRVFGVILLQSNSYKHVAHYTHIQYIRYSLVWS